MLEQITDTVVSWGSGFGLVGLAVVSATEAALQPVPPDLLVIPMSLDANSEFELLAIFLVGLVSGGCGQYGSGGIPRAWPER